MPNLNFDEFVRRQQEIAQSGDQEPVDWQREKTVWLARLDDLYQSAHGFLRSYIDLGQVKTSFEDIRLEEGDLGLYTAKRMLISIGRQQVALEPIGTMLIGSAGRVDVVGALGRAQLLLLRSSVRTLSDLVHVSVGVNGALPMPPAPKKRTDIEWSWRIMGRPPQRTINEFNKENFLSLLTEISNA